MEKKQFSVAHLRVRDWRVERVKVKKSRHILQKRMMNICKYQNFLVILRAKFARAQNLPCKQDKERSLYVTKNILENTIHQPMH